MSCQTDPHTHETACQHDPGDHHEHDHHEHDGHDHDHHGHDDHDHAHHGHDHGHDHDHGTGFLAGLRHGVSEIFGAHSHDHTDQIDDALEANAAGRRALWISLGMLAVTAAAQGVIVVLTGSVALLGDTLHNVGDALTAVPILVAFTLSARAATSRFTYGYGRSEDLAGLFVVAMIAISAAVAGYAAVRRFFHPEQVEYLGTLALAGIIGFIGNEVVARYRITVGRRIGSAALVADGLHARTDGFTSLAVVLSAGGLALGWDWADPVIGCLIALAIIGVLRSAVAQVGLRLMDGVEPSLVERAREAVLATPGVATVDLLQMRWVGHGLHVDVDAVAAGCRTLAEATAVQQRIETELGRALRRLQTVRVRVRPES